MDDKKKQKLKEAADKLNNKQFTFLLFGEVVKKMDKDDFTMAKAIVKLGLVVQALVKEEIISEQRGIDMAVSASEIINEFFEQRDKNTEMNV